MYCKECGKEISEGAAFCGECGAKTDAASNEAPKAPPTGPLPSYKIDTSRPTSSYRTEIEGTRQLGWATVVLLLISPLMLLIRWAAVDTAEYYVYWTRYSNTSIIPDGTRGGMLVAFVLLMSLAIGLMATSKAEKQVYMVYVIVNSILIFLDLLIGLAVAILTVG